MKPAIIRNINSNFLIRLLLAMSCIIILSSLVACGSDASSKTAAGPARPARLVSSYTIPSTANGQILNISGVTEPIRRTQPAARIMARVLEAGFQEGDRVNAGQVLVRLDTRDLQAQKNQAQAALQTAATAQEVARLNLERIRTLHKAGTVSRSQLEKMEVAYSQANAAVAAAKSGCDSLDVNLSYAVAAAPFSGVIVRKMVEDGAMVAPGQPLFIIEDYSRLRVIAALAADLASGLKTGQQLGVRMGGERVTGIIEGIVSSGLTQAPGQRVQLLIDNPSQRFKAGDTAVVEIPDSAGRDPAEIMIPKDALFTHGRLTGAYVAANDSTAHLHWLIVGQNRGGMAVVLSGLKAGDRVILNPERAALCDGAPIKEMAR